MANGYVPLDVLAATLGLPHGYLRNLALTGRIPFLNVNGRKRFDEQQVREALKALAASSAFLSKAQARCVPRELRPQKDAGQGADANGS